jgi:endonuclease/exonuclease/phosphatase family metal-dependent hydrolase
MTCPGESPREARSPINLLSTRTSIRIGTWNVRTLYETGKIAQVANEMRKYRIKVLGLSETRWNGSGLTRLVSGETIIYSGHTDHSHEHTHGVALLLAAEATRALLAWEPVSSRLISARFNSKGRNVTVIQCYAPTNTATEEEKEEFYRALQSLIDRSPRRDIKIVMGDMNAKVGCNNAGREHIMGKHGLGTCNENGSLFTDFCTFNDLVIGGTIFPHKTIHKTTWISPDGKTANQIDHIAIARRWRGSLQDVRAWRGADAASDHQLVVATMRTKLRAAVTYGGRQQYGFNTRPLSDNRRKAEFTRVARGKINVVDNWDNKTVEEHWREFQEAWTSACKEVLGKREGRQKEWLTQTTWALINRRKELRQKLHQCTNERLKERLRAQYWDMNKEVKKQARNDKRQYINALTEEAESAAGTNNLKRLYEITRMLAGKRPNPVKPVRDKNGKMITSETAQRARWAEHFDEVLNRPPPPRPSYKSMMVHQQRLKS